MARVAELLQLTAKHVKLADELCCLKSQGVVGDTVSEVLSSVGEVRLLLLLLYTVSLNDQPNELKLLVGGRILRIHHQRRLFWVSRRTRQF